MMRTKNPEAAPSSHWPEVHGSCQAPAEPLAADGGTWLGSGYESWFNGWQLFCSYWIFRWPLHYAWRQGGFAWPVRWTPTLPSFGPLEANSVTWLHANSAKQKPVPRSGSAWGGTLPPLKSQDEWGAELWLGNRGSQHQCSQHPTGPNASCVLSEASSACPNSAQMVHQGLRIKGQRQGFLDFLFFSKSQQGKEMHEVFIGWALTGCWMLVF